MGRRTGDQQGVAIRRGLGDVACGNRGGGAGLVLDDGWRFQTGEPLKFYRKFQETKFYKLFG
jgi:hypothetical protein